MTTAVHDWQRWRERWSSPDAVDIDPNELRNDIDSAIRREHRALRRTQLKVAIVSGVALLSVAGALLHEARTLDLVFAAILLVAVIAVAVLDVVSGRIPVDVTSRSTRVFVELSIDRLRRELKISQLILLPLLTEVGFFLQWWIGGIPFHEHEPFAPVVVLTGWLPLFGMVAVLIWVSRLSARVRSELRGLTALAGADRF
jgi:uncharacterized membrane protein (UPF0136 family)